jgi:YfiH family protein
LADGNVGYSPPRDRDDAWAMRQRWAAAHGMDADRIATLGQIHGAEVCRVGAAEAGVGGRPGSDRVGLGDAMIAGEPGVVLMTLHADCLPILLADPDRPAIAAIHAGWRGTVADVAGATVRAMREAFGSQPARLVAYLGPAIGPCCYEVGPEVTAAWRAVVARLDLPLAADAVATVGDATRLDLHAANRALLARAGLRFERMEHSPICTRCAGHDWFSHRGQGPLTGRFGAMIALAEGAAPVGGRA